VSPRKGMAEAGKGPRRAFYDRPRLSRHRSLVGQSLRILFFLRENLIRSAVGPACTRFEITFTRGPASFFPAPRGYGAVIKARRVSGRVPPGVSGAQGRRPLVSLQSPSGWIPSPCLISRFVSSSKSFLPSHLRPLLLAISTSLPPHSSRRSPSFSLAFLLSLSIS